MSENITHTAVTDDCTRLALHSPSICNAFKLCLSEHLDIVRLGGVTRSGGNFMLPLLGRFRRVWADRRKPDRLEEKLAYVLGWHTHRAADLQMKPIFEAVDKECPLFPTDCSIYHDVFLFREIYGSGRHEPYSLSTLEREMESLPGTRAVRIVDAEGLFRSVWQQKVLDLHSLATDGDGGQPWMRRVLATRQEIRADLDRYTEAFKRPQPEKMRRFIQDINFYDRNDPIIRLARAIQHRDAMQQKGDLTAAVEAAGTQSQYAQALRKGYRYLVAASDYFRGAIDEEDYKDALERGKQGVN